MLNFWISFLSCTFIISSAISTHLDPGEYGNNNLWRKAICEKNSEDLNADLENCFQMEQKPVREAYLDCYKEAAPEVEGKLAAYMVAACEDKAIFHKFDSCIKEYEANASFKQQMELTKETEECYKSAIKTHDLPELMVYFDGTSKL